MDSRDYLIRSLFYCSGAASILAIGLYATLVVTFQQVWNVPYSEWDYVVPCVPSALFIIVTVFNLNNRLRAEFDFLVLRLFFLLFILYVLFGHIVITILTIPFFLYIRMMVGPLLIFTGVCLAVRYQACVWYYANRLPDQPED